jgi:type IV secretion system protein VirB9
MRGEKRLYPERVFDDGSSVYLAWSPDRPLPAVLGQAPDGKSEGPVNFTARGEFLVIDGLHTRLILRSGRDVAFVESTPKSPESSRVQTHATAAR